ncbi:MAG TPA: T9SS type A sorting domain-containing protein, partial [Bacteroidales bacterium]|nr:T9SS type A sorting domain-containing protein [Bacteroidales bacterium]
ATRYDGENGELDLEVVDEVSTYPAAEHGKLSTLLEWNMQDLPDEFERNRNNVIFNWQQNRNPFIDHPEFAELIWNGQSADAVTIDNMSISEDIDAETPVNITADVTSSNGTVSEAKIMWGLSFESLNNEVTMSQSGDTFTAEIPAQAEESHVYYQVVASDGTVTDESVVYHYYIPPTFNGELVTIYDIQGQTSLSPMADQIEDGSGVEELGYGEVSTSGVVTANFGTNYFVQDGEGPWNGLLVYDPSRNPQIGDSIIITGIVKEYYNVTEMTEISTYYHIASGKTPPQVTDMNTGDASEQYEGVMVRVTDAECTDANYQSNYYMWTVDDGSGELYIHNTSTYEFVPTEGANYTITGPLNWDFGEWKIELRYEDDVQGITDIEAPEISEINIVSETKIEIYFSEDVEEESAENENNYSMSSDVEIEKAVRHLVLDDKVTLTVSALTPGEYYELTINNVEDQYGNATEDLVYEFGYQTSIEEVMNKNSFKVFPNPTTADFIVSFKSKKESSVLIKVIDSRGQVFKRLQTSAQQGSNTIDIGMSQAHQGIYMLILEFPEGRIIQKIIKK